MPAFSLRPGLPSRVARAGVLGWIAVLACLAPAVRAQDAGSLRGAAESYHDTLPGESVNGIGLDFRQLLPFGGLLIGEAVFLRRPEQAALRTRVLAVADAAG